MPNVRMNVSAALAQCALEQYAAGFASRTDPYGERWAPRKHAGDGHPLLERTGALKASGRVVRVTERGFRIRIAVPYSGYVHAARPLVPIASRGLGQWSPMFYRIGAASMRRELR